MLINNDLLNRVFLKSLNLLLINLLFWGFYTIFGKVAFADVNKEVMDRIPYSNLKNVVQIIKRYEKRCAELKVNNKPILKVYKNNFISTKLLQGNTELTIVTAGFGCLGIGHPWSGSSGSPAYFIVGNRIFEGPRGTPSFHNVGNRTIILNWHHGLYCKTTGMKGVSGADPCFSVIYWDEKSRSFVSFNGDLKIEEINLK